jgi:hypothetical protein
MKGLSVIVALVVLVLWAVGFTYIVAPISSSISIPIPPIGNVPPAFLGVLLFLLGIVFIVLWAGWTPESANPEEGKAAEIKQ